MEQGDWFLTAIQGWGNSLIKHSNLFSLMWKSENGGQIKKVKLTHVLTHLKQKVVEMTSRNTIGISNLYLVFILVFNVGVKLNKTIAVICDMSLLIFRSSDGHGT